MAARESPGGMRLRALRERLGKTQLWVELEAGLGTGYLQRVESGRVVQPSRRTVERILDALEARFSERREIMELFGYRVAAEPPGDDDVAWARQVVRAELDAFPFPAYVLDCTTRLLAWNAAVPRLLGVAADDATLGGLAGQLMLAAWFDPASLPGRMLLDAEASLPAMVRAFRHELEQFRGEGWCEALVARLCASPRFRAAWQRVEEDPPRPTATRALVPLRLALPGGAIASFRLASEPFTRDARFRIVYYFPDDVPTMRLCTGGRARRAETA